MRLNQQMLSSLSLTASPKITLPLYERDQLRAGILHIGLGAFARAHIAVYIDQYLSNHADHSAVLNWGIIGANLKNSATAEALNPQDGLYLVEEEGECRLIGSIFKVIDASHPSNRNKLLETIADPDIKIISITVTEKGYRQAPMISKKSDETSLLQILYHGLLRRYQKNKKPVTLLSLDNLSQNGQVLNQAIHNEIADSELNHSEKSDFLNWFLNQVTTPCSVVDRIVPKTNPEDIQRISQKTGVFDHWPIVTEAFKQWVVEDKFCAGRPALEDIGVLFVDDVSPYEKMKLRMLNASHSTLSWMGTLGRYQTVDQASNDPVLYQFLRAMMHEEIIPILNKELNHSLNIDLIEYADNILKRFQNPIGHHLLQIAMDSSQKLPQRLIDSILTSLNHGLENRRLIFSLATWMAFTLKISSLNDPLSGIIDEKIAGFNAHNNFNQYALDLLSIEDIFKSSMKQNHGFVIKLTDDLKWIMHNDIQQIAGNL